jgi:hypothetical protein
MLLDWEHYPPDTWAAELDEHMFLIKYVEEGEYVYVFGTLHEPVLSGHVVTLSEAQAIANRYVWLVNNVTGDNLEALINKL